ncbi:MAG: mannose-1-phosphate guanylyltransferase/mannose-6-phosphate isomerase [Rhodospirillales bacterium]|nr:mannose-1-phosphate guanylyltransferase/mannose-6-phosphate isomerase [Rhodospirillales bacterium]
MSNTPLIYPVILSGGAGTRLWPVSRHLKPKQFHPLVSDQSLFSQTLVRVNDRRFAAPTVICNADHRFLVAEEFRAADKQAQAIVLEPAPRNTAPAIAAAAFLLAEIDPQLIMAVLPSDHVIGDTTAFYEAVDCAANAAAQGKLATFGISPTRAETGYGYIQAGATIDGWDGAMALDRFVEKPDAATAQSYLDAGCYYWNSGMFVFRVCDFLGELQSHAPEVWRQTRNAVAQRQDEAGFIRLDATAFAAAPAISVDYAVMEKTRQAVVIPSDFGWSDVGSWMSLRENGTPDLAGNVILGDVVLYDTKTSYVQSDRQLAVVIGMEDTIVVATDDAILIAPATRDQDVRLAVEALKQQGRSEAVAHSQVFRPWGSYQNLHQSDGILVKQIIVNPGARLSLQYHNHRAEHWVVVEGAARVTNGDRVMDLQADQSTYIPVGTVHRLENTGLGPLRMMEVQVGDLISEDDIVRVDDDFGRA